tara:strand:+ start:605 stop:832 length:228 start_codon:yes stop_codon:yes gene_type:complete
MSLEYVDRLLELRKKFNNLDTKEIKVEIKKSLVNKPDNSKNVEEEENSIEKFQEDAFLDVMLDAKRLKEQANGSV